MARETDSARIGTRFGPEPTMTWQGDGPPVLGIDLGGTKILVGVVGSDHRILGRAKRTTPAKEGGPAILEAMIGVRR